MIDYAAKLSRHFNVPAGEIAHLIAVGDISIRSKTEPAPAHVHSSYQMQDGSFVYILMAAHEKIRARNVTQLLTAIDANDQPSAQKSFRAINPADPATTPLTISGVTSFAAAASQMTTVMAPQAITISAASRFTRDIDYVTEAALFGTVERGAWISGWDYILQDGHVISDSGYLPIDIPISALPHLHLAAEGRVVHHATQPVEVAKEVLFLSAPVQGHIGHWIIDFLPRLLGREFENHPLIAPSWLTPKHLETLAVLGVNTSDLMLIPHEQHTKFKKIHVYRPGRSMPPNPKHIEFVRRGMFRGSRPRTGKHVFLARHSVNTRLASNAAAFQDFLEAHNFIVADMANLTIAQQQDLLGDADVLMGAFGSNLLALYHAPPTSKIIVLETQADMDPTIAHSAHYFGIEHRALFCPPTGNSKARMTHKKDVDFNVDLDALREILTA